MTSFINKIFNNLFFVVVLLCVIVIYFKLKLYDIVYTNIIDIINIIHNIYFKSYDNISFIIVFLSIIVLTVSVLFLSFKDYIDIFFKQYKFKICLRKDFYKNILVIIFILMSLSCFHLLPKYIGYFFLLFSILCFVKVFFSLFFAKNLQDHNSEKDKNSNFISDKPIDDIKKDLLNLNDKVKYFAEQVYYDTEGLVFGLEAPWGGGKTSFIELCKQYWASNNKDNKHVVVYNFEPLRHIGKKDFIDIFSEGLIEAISRQSNIARVVDIKSSIKKYAKILKGYSFFGIKLDFIDNIMDNYNSDKALKELNSILKRENIKIIIIIDDLDRMLWADIKDIIFTIRKSFVLESVSYILCYDYENIGVLENDSPNIEKINEFLEKFVNVRYNLCYNIKDGINKFLKDFEKDESKNIYKVLEEFKKICNSEDYIAYKPFISTLRKIKRFINTIKMLKIHFLDISIIDYDCRDLINLLFIYLNYPNLFFCLYNIDEILETDLVSQTKVFTKTYENSIEKFIKDDKQKFLLDQIFNINKYNEKYENSSDYDRLILSSTKALYNHKTYMIFIVDNISKEYNYKNLLVSKNDIFNRNKTVNEVFENYEINKHCDLWTLIIQSYTELNKNELKNIEIAKDLIEYLVNKIPEYSSDLCRNFFGYITYREYAIFILCDILDKFGWFPIKADIDNIFKNEDKIEIIEWIFGTDRHKDYSILDKLSQPNSDILGFYNLVVFLRCLLDDEYKFINIKDALLIGGNNNYREKICNEVFNVFKVRYIDTHINFIEDIYNINNFKPDSDNDYKKNVKDQIFYKIKDIFGIQYVYTSYNIDYHNTQIRSCFLDYLFNVCFDLDKSEKNAEYFADLLLNLLLSYKVNNSPNANSFDINIFTKILDEGKLIKYWSDYGDKIKNILDSEKINPERFLNNTDFKVSYRDLPLIFKVLDDYINNPQHNSIK